MMKNVFILLILVFSGVASAQIINFPDPNLKNALVNSNCVDTNGDGVWDDNADLNGDGELDVNEALSVIRLNVTNKQITKMDGIENFKNLNILSCGNNKIAALNVSELTNLTTLYCFNNQLVTLNVSGLTNLKTLSCFNNQLTFLDVKEFSNLEYLSCSQNKLTSLILDGLGNLNTLFCGRNLLTSLNVEGLNKDGMIIFCNNNQLTSLDLSPLNFMWQLECQGNKLTSLILSDLRIQSINCENNQLTSLYLKDVNGLADINFSGNLDLVYICSKENQVSALKNQAISYGLTNCEVNSYCTFNPGGTFYTIQGMNIFDDNKNGCDDLDVRIPNLKYNISYNGNITGAFISNSTGNYNIPVPAGTHIITPILENPDFFTVTPDSLTVTFPSTFDSFTQNFCIAPKNPFRHVDITIFQLSPPARPGFDADYKIIWENKGNLLESGTLHFNYDEAIFDFVSATINPDVIVGGNLKWNYIDLLPFERREVIVTLNLNSPAETPAVNSGDIIYLYANILDNVFKLENTIVGSFDPNDKTCLQGNYFNIDSVGKYVDFLIRFENTGNYAAENVVIKDIIDTTTFDVSSLIITDASHEVYTRIAGNKVEFIFENIQLPFEDETNDGYVAFKIKTKSTLKLGDELKNLADIYFDYNLPIRTNETITRVAIPSGTTEVYEDINVYPNPVQDILILEGNTSWLKAEIYDILGRIIMVTGIEDFQIDVSGMDSGTYILKLYDREKTGVVRFVKL